MAANRPRRATASVVSYNEPSEDEASHDEESCSSPETERDSGRDHGETDQATESESESMASDEDEDSEEAPPLSSTEGDELDDMLADAGDMTRDEIIEAVNQKL
ncbi:hypothetical protein SLS58_008017 [Diplodia intermedia]|uniref:Uncharacterized protein n=1 Tax=Diplodia intermedia TaxID=856260 RepID=A0ABR3TIQ7_9PEZI